MTPPHTLQCGHSRVETSAIVKTWVKPWTAGRGSTRSMWMWEKGTCVSPLLWSSGNPGNSKPKGGCPYSCPATEISKRAGDRSHRVWRASKAGRRNSRGRRGQPRPVEVEQSSTGCRLVNGLHVAREQPDARGQNPMAQKFDLLLLAKNGLKRVQMNTTV